MNKLNPIRSEKIIKLGKIVYMKLFDDNGYISNNKIENFHDKKGTYECIKLFWRFYWIITLPTR